MATSKAEAFSKSEKRGTKMSWEVIATPVHVSKALGDKERRRP